MSSNNACATFLVVARESNLSKEVVVIKPGKRNGFTLAERAAKDKVRREYNLPETETIEAYWL